MGKIIGLKNLNDNRIILNLEVNLGESIRLKGNLENIQIFSENNLACSTRIVKRGKRESTKYILIPKEYRDEIKPNENIRCKKIDCADKIFLVFEIPKT